MEYLNTFRTLINTEYFKEALALNMKILKKYSVKQKQHLEISCVLWVSFDPQP